MAGEHEPRFAIRYRRLRMTIAVTPEAIGYEQEASYKMVAAGLRGPRGRVKGDYLSYL